MVHVNPIQVQKFLKGVDYPASKQTLIDKAKSMGADENVCASLEQLPDQDFQTPAEVSQAFGALPDEAQGAKGAAKEDAKEGGAKEGGQARHATKGPQARKDTAHRPSGSDEFLVEAMQDAMAEIQICELALEKLEEDDAQRFAQAMLDEHGRMGRELEKLACGKHLDPPRQLRREQAMTVDELSSLDGRDFAQRWIQYNIDVHERDIKVFRHYAGEEYDPDIRDMARRHAEAFGKHLKMAHDLGRKLARA